MSARWLTAIRVAFLAMMCACPVVRLAATSGIVLRSSRRIVLAIDSRAVYRQDGNRSECKLFQTRDVYAAVSGLARYGTSYRATDSVRDGFAGTGSFSNHLSAAADLLQMRVERLLGSLQVSNPAEYRYLLRPMNSTGDLVQLAVIQMVRGQAMMGIIELQWSNEKNDLSARITTCPGNCRQDTEVFYLGYWDHIKPYVGNSGHPRSLGSAASLDRLIRLEMNAHPTDVGAPINILELTPSGARWLQNGGNCALPGVRQ
jgi:hypothetical protein